MLHVVTEKVEKKKITEMVFWKSRIFQTVIKISSLTSYCSLNTETGKARNILYIYCTYAVEYTVDLSHSEAHPAESNNAKRTHSFKPTQTYSSGKRTDHQTSSNWNFITDLSRSNPSLLGVTKWIPRNFSEDGITDHKHFQQKWFFKLI